MNALLKLLLCCVMPLYIGDDDTGGTDNDDTGGVDNAAPGNVDNDDAAGKSKEPAEPKPVSVDDMAKAIGNGLAGKTDDKIDSAGKPAKKDDALAPAIDKLKPDGTEKSAAEIESETQAAAIRAEQAAETKRKATEKADTVALAKKKPDDFKLTDDERKVLTPRANQRFQELTRYATVQHERAESIAAEVVKFKGAHDGFMKTLTDAQCAPEDLATLLDYNYRAKSGDFEGALKIINATRAGLLRQLGREEPGVDLIAEFPDLKTRVDANELSREDALQLAQARRNAANQTATATRTRTAAQQQQEIERVQDDAVKAIGVWSDNMKATDMDFAAKEAIVNGQIPDIMRRYQPDQWLSTIELLYKNTRIVKNAPVPKNQPLRASGQGGGTKTPTNMGDALRQGLGYTAAN